MEPRHSPCSRVGYFLNGAVFLAVLVVVALLFDRWLPYPDVPVVEDKLRYLSLHGNDYDTIFIGSSRVNFQVMPAIFDQTLAARGRASKSFNAGILGMRPPEQGFVLDQVLRQPHRRLRWVVIELTSIEARVPKSRRGSARYVFWHDGPRMMLLLTWLRAEWKAVQEEIPAAGGSKWADFFEPLSVCLSHVPPFLEKTVNLGRASFLSERLLLPPRKWVKKQNDWQELGKDRDGWKPYALSETMSEKERAKYEDSYAARRHSPATHFHDPASDAAMQAMSAAVTRAGATPIFILPPMTTERHYYPPPEQAATMIIWSFSDLQRYQDLFADSSRVDDAHLNSAGAKLFTLALAERFLELSAE